MLDFLKVETLSECSMKDYFQETIFVQFIILGKILINILLLIELLFLLYWILFKFYYVIKDYKTEN